MAFILKNASLALSPHGIASSVTYMPEIIKTRWKIEEIGASYGHEFSDFENIF